MDEVCFGISFGGGGSLDRLAVRDYDRSMAVKRLLGKVLYKANLAGQTWIVGVELPELANFVPGQYVSLKVSESFRRSYSVASLPGGRRIDLVVDVSPMGVGSKYVLGLKVGDTVEILGFLGKFAVSDEILDTKKELLFVATGTGIAPIKPMIENILVIKGFGGKVDLVWGMRYESDLYWLKEMGALQRDYDNFHFEIVLSKPGNDWPGESGHVGDVVGKFLVSNEDKTVFLCGNPEMIVDMKNKLNKSGIADENIIVERFA
jgi:NAD(P)H-flavin reductase